MGKSTISMAIFNSYVSLPEGSSRVFIMVDQQTSFFGLQLVAIRLFSVQNEWPREPYPILASYNPIPLRFNNI